MSPRVVRGRRLSLILCLWIVVPSIDAQSATGGLSGVVVDASDRVVASAEITATSRDTGLVRTTVSSDGGQYAIAVLPPGEYVVSARIGRLRSRGRAVVVQAGVTARADLQVQLEVTDDGVTVRGADRLRQDHHQVASWITRDRIEQQPLNGRNVLEIVKTEPGIAAPVRLAGGRVFVAPQGVGLHTVPRIGFTRVTIDGASVETPGTQGFLLHPSPEAVDQVHVATAGFQAVSGLATSGVIDIVTRAGTNEFHGGGFLLFRDRQWSAFPGLPDGEPGDPSFRRAQAGATLGGPIRRNRAFFFAAYERHDQRDVIPVVISDPELHDLQGVPISPYSGQFASVRFDVQPSAAHRVFLRHSRDANRTFTGGDAGAVLPSAWTSRPVDAHQTLAAVTSAVSSQAVTDVRASWFAVRTGSTPATSRDCPAPCFGLDAPRIMLSSGAADVLTLGRAPSQWVDGRRLQLSPSMAWHAGAHALRVGGDWEFTSHSQTTGHGDAGQIVLWSPSAVRQLNPSIALPDGFSTVEDLLRLPLRSFTTTVGSANVLQRGFGDVRSFHVLRLFASDEWRAHRRLTLNGGVTWALEPHVLNDDLAKPSWLAPLVGANGLRVRSRMSSVSGSAGLAWRASADGRTVLRAGAGHYFDSIARTVTLNLFNERAQLSPLGTGRLSISGANLVWDGHRLNFAQPTSYTGADLLAVLPDIRGALGQLINPGNRDLSILNLDRTREGRNLYDPAYTAPRAWHASAGIERELAGGIVVGADLVWKRFAHTMINGIDYNRFFSAAGPVIPACTAAQRSDLLAVCSNGALYFDTTIGRARSFGVLVRAEHRFTADTRILASYAYGRLTGMNGTGVATTEQTEGRATGFNADDWDGNDGPVPTDLRHIVNLSGSLALPWRLRLTGNLSAHSRPPFSAYVGGLDFNGDGTVNDLLPGTTINGFNRGLDRDDLVRLVADYNARIAGIRTPGGQVAPGLTLPESFAFNDNFLTVDLRVAREFAAGPRARLALFVDVFNVSNVMNTLGYSGNLASPASFGRPTARAGRAFGSGGPRAAQVGIRIDY